MAAGAFADVKIYLAGRAYAGFIPSTKNAIAVTAAAPLNPGDVVYVEIYNPSASAQFYSAVFNLLKVNA